MQSPNARSPMELTATVGTDVVQIRSEAVRLTLAPQRGVWTEWAIWQPQTDMFLYKVFQLDLGDPGGCILGVLSDATHGWELVPKHTVLFWF